jgi:hypothetical protein
VRDEREGAGHGVCELEVRSIEEHSSVADAVRAERRIGDSGGADRRRSELVQVIIVTGHTLPTPTQLAALIEPPPQPVEDDDLVPKGAFGINRAHRWHGQVKRRLVIADYKV